MLSNLGNFLLNYREKIGKGKREMGEDKKENIKGKGKKMKIKG